MVTKKFLSPTTRWSSK